MSIKYILIPYDRYQALIKDPSKNQNFLEQTIEKYKDGPLYNAAYAQYLHHLQKTPQYKSINSSYPQTTFTDRTEETQQPTFITPISKQLTEKSLKSTPSQIYPELPKIPLEYYSPSKTDTYTVDDSSSSEPSTEYHTPKKSKKKSDIDINAIVKSKLQKVEKRIIQHRNKYGVNSKSQILNKKNKPIVNSDISHTLHRLAFPGEPGDSTPPGTKELQPRLSPKTKEQIVRINPKNWNK